MDVDGDAKGCGQGGLFNNISALSSSMQCIEFTHLRPELVLYEFAWDFQRRNERTTPFNKCFS